jgi:hypothetical protein
VTLPFLQKSKYPSECGRSACQKSFLLLYFFAVKYAILTGNARRLFLSERMDEVYLTCIQLDHFHSCIPLLSTYGILMTKEIVPEQNVLPYLEHLPPEAQEEAATYIAALTEALEFESLVLGRKRPAPRQIVSVEQWEDPAGAWRDLPDTLLEELDDLRHSSPPTPPIEL